MRLPSLKLSSTLPFLLSLASTLVNAVAVTPSSSQTPSSPGLGPRTNLQNVKFAQCTSFSSFNEPVTASDPCSSSLFFYSGKSTTTIRCDDTAMRTIAMLTLDPHFVITSIPQIRVYNFVVSTVMGGQSSTSPLPHYLSCTLLLWSTLLTQTSLLLSHSITTHVYNVYSPRRREPGDARHKRSIPRPTH